VIYEPDPVKRAELWDRCYPGNVNVEALVDELRDEVVRLRQKLATLQDPTEEGVIADVIHKHLLSFMSVYEEEAREEAWSDDVSGLVKMSDPDKRIISEIRLYGLSWLGKLWADKEAMRPVAKAILTRVKSITS